MQPGNATIGCVADPRSYGETGCANAIFSVVVTAAHECMACMVHPAVLYILNASMLNNDNSMLIVTTAIVKCFLESPVQLDIKLSGPGASSSSLQQLVPSSPAPTSFSSRPSCLSPPVLSSPLP